jgi:hypothetical protein
MKALGYGLITLGFLTAAFFAVQSAGIEVGAYLVGLALGATGVATVRVATHRAARTHELVAANIETISASLRALVERADTLWAERESVDVYDLRHRIDELFPPHLDAFVQARETLKVSYGLQAYADVMNPFSAGERYLNRVWSASTDGWIDEAHEYLGRAREQLTEAREVFARLTERS